MADRRRRRRRASQDSEDESGSGSGSDSGRSASPSAKAPELREVCEAERSGDRRPERSGDRRPERSGDRSHEESECESEDGVGEAVLSDYDSADPEDNGSHSEGGEDEEEPYVEQTTAAAEEPKAPPTGPPSPPQHNTPPPKDEPRPPDEKSNVTGERQSGDGQESTEDPEVGKQKLDDDEDRKNPAYIPRRGLFFEHDLRGASEEERPKGRNRKLWKDEGRWEHDKFREDEQAPKSREELIAIYGYDIRNGGDRPRPRRNRQGSSPGRDKRRWEGPERGVRSWQSGGPTRPPPQAQSTQTVTQTAPRTKPVPQRPRNYQQNHPPYRPTDGHRSAPPQTTRGDRHMSPKSLEFTAGGGGVPSGRGGRGYRAPPPDDITGGLGSVADPVSNESSGVYPHHQLEQKPLPPALPSPAPSLQPPRDPSPSERPPERKSYSLVRRTRSRPADMGSKQASVEEALSPKPGWVAPGDGPAGRGAEPAGRGAEPAGRGAESSSGGLSELDQDLARLSLAGQNWSQNPTSYIRSEIRGLTNPLHMPSGPAQYQALDEMNSNRAKRYSSQRQRNVQEPALHLGVMEGHYYEPMSYQGPIYAHGEGPAPLPPQGMLVQPEMHLPHPGLHPHQSAAPITNPALYGAPPVSLSPGQPQQLLPPPFYPPPGVMTFPYPAMYPPSPQGQAQVTYGGVTYYDTMQQQAQPKPSPPRRTSQPVTVKAPPPDLSVNMRVPPPELSINLHAPPTDLE